MDGTGRSRGVTRRANGPQHAEEEGAIIKKGNKVNMPRFTYNKNKRISSSSIGPSPPMVKTNMVTCTFHS